MNVRLTQKQKIQILNSADIYKVMQQILLRENKLRRNQEHFWVVGLDNRNKILFIELIALGRVNRVDANPPDVFRMAIYKLAVKMILVHNHPSGDVSPSPSDEDFTDKMLKVGKLINIDVIDHLVISEETYTSFADKGIIDKLHKSGLFEIVERDKQQIKDWKVQIEKEKVLKENNLGIARRMIADGLDIDTIKKYTGLTKADIKKL